MSVPQPMGSGASAKHEEVKVAKCTSSPLSLQEEGGDGEELGHEAGEEAGEGSGSLSYFIGDPEELDSCGDDWFSQPEPAMEAKFAGPHEGQDRQRLDCMLELFVLNLGIADDDECPDERASRRVCAASEGGEGDGAAGGEAQA